MDNVRLNVQIDFGVGDVMVPGPRVIQYPVFLGGDMIELLAYPIESAIAEKLQAMVALGSANSRMKDFYDVWIYSKHLDFHADALLEAIEATFRNRKTLVPAEEFDALTAIFIEGHRVQWSQERKPGCGHRPAHSKMACPGSFQVIEFGGRLRHYELKAKRQKQFARGCAPSTGSRTCGPALRLATARRHCRSSKLPGKLPETATRPIS
jgi:hypothetical protein